MLNKKMTKTEIKKILNHIHPMKSKIEKCLYCNNEDVESYNSYIYCCKCYINEIANQPIHLQSKYYYKWVVSPQIKENREKIKELIYSDLENYIKYDPVNNYYYLDCAINWAAYYYKWFKHKEKPQLISCAEVWRDHLQYVNWDINNLKGVIVIETIKLLEDNING